MRGDSEPPLQGTWTCFRQQRKPRTLLRDWLQPPLFPERSGPAHILLGSPCSTKVSQATLKWGTPTHPTHGNTYVHKWIYLLSQGKTNKREGRNVPLRNVIQTFLRVEKQVLGYKIQTSPTTARKGPHALFSQASVLPGSTR